MSTPGTKWTGGNSTVHDAASEEACKLLCCAANEIGSCEAFNFDATASAQEACVLWSDAPEYAQRGVAGWTAGTLATPAECLPVSEFTVHAYLNFGSTRAQPLKWNCDAWVALFAPNGTASTPGAPTAVGSTQLLEACETITSSFKVLLANPSGSDGIQPVFRADGKTLDSIAFSWKIIGTATSDGSYVGIPAISTLEFNSNGKISRAKDFFDSSLLPPATIVRGARGVKSA